MAHLEILKKAFAIIIVRPKWWLYGFLLSAGLNLHWIFFFNQEISDKILFTFYIITDRSVEYWYVWILPLLVMVVLSVMVKLAFLAKIHSVLHIAQSENCLLCLKSATEETQTKVVRERWVLEKSIVVSLITIIMTLLFVYIIHVYLSVGIFGTLNTVFMGLSLLILLLVVSLWNIFTVLLIQWYGQSIVRATKTILNLFFLRFKQIFGFTIILILLFTFLTAIGTILVGANSISLDIFFEGQSGFFAISSVMMFIVFSTIFIIWVLLNIVFYNTALVVLFDDIIKGAKIYERDFVLPLKQHKPVVLGRQNSVKL